MLSPKEIQQMRKDIEFSREVYDETDDLGRKNCFLITANQLERVLDAIEKFNEDDQ